jgi:chaperonin GroEL (HSP60 family)
MATRAALNSGILPGSGSIWRVPKKVAGGLYDILQIPFNLLSEEELLNVSDTFWEGYDFKTGKYGDLYEMGIVEPFSVTENCLLNAVSTASLILTCDCLILKN